MRKIQTIMQLIGSMRPIGPIGLMRLIGKVGILFFILQASFLISSCSTDQTEPLPEPEPETDPGVPVQVVSYVREYTDNEQQTKENRWMTRTDPEPVWEAPDGYELLPNSVAIGSFFTSGSSKQARRIYYGSDSKWYMYKDMVEPAGSYQLYGYAPYDAATPFNETVTGSDISGNNTFADGAVITLKGLSTVMSEDLCVLVGARHGSNNYTPESPGLKRGKFDCDIKAGGSGNENHLFMLFDHLCAALVFRFRVDENYARLRTIKLKRLTLTAYTYTDDSSTATKMGKNMDVTVTLLANNEGASPIQNVVFSESYGDDMQQVEIFNDVLHGGTQLPSGKDGDGQYIYTEEAGYVPYFNLTPNKKVLYKLLSTYDVYDKNITEGHPDGNLIRENCEAENTILIQDKFGNSQLDRGYKYNLKITVMPTYLYVLSEPDLDNPSVVVE